MSELEQAARQLQEAEITLAEFIEISGKYWYERFEKLLGNAYENLPAVYEREIVLKLAKRASGIEDQPDHVISNGTDPLISISQADKYKLDGDWRP